MNTQEAYTGESEAYLKMLGSAGNVDGDWLCLDGEKAGVCPHCGQSAVGSGEAVVMDWEGNGQVSQRYASYCGCGQRWIEEAAPWIG